MLYKYKMIGYMQRGEKANVREGTLPQIKVEVWSVAVIALM